VLVLGIESSCDETAAAVVRDGQLLSNIIASQIKDHSIYGGVVPEIASRKHIEAITPVIMEAIADARISLADVEGIAVTRGPGLIGSLLVGLSTAKALAYGLHIPFVGVNHLEGHIMASFLAEEKPQFPFAAPTYTWFIIITILNCWGSRVTTPLVKPLIRQRSCLISDIREEW